MPKPGMVAVAIVLAVAVVACGEAGGGARTATPGSSPTAAAGPSPTSALRTIGGVAIAPLEFGGEAEFPEGVSAIVETGCYNCDGPATGLIRVSRGPAAGFQRETLLSLEMPGLGPRLVEDAFGVVTEAEPHIVNYAFNADASQAVVGVCTRGFCVELGGEPSADAETTLFRSPDGGETWEEWGVLAGSAGPLALSPGGALLTRWEADGGGVRFEMYPSGEAVAAPAGSDPLRWPLALPGGELLWSASDGRLLRSDGSVFLDLGGDPDHEYQVTTLVADPAGETLLFGLYESHFEGEFLERFFLFTTDGNGRVGRVFSTDFLPWLGAFLAPGLFLGNADVQGVRDATAGLTALSGPVPVIIDLEAGVAHPVFEPFSEPDFPKGRNFLVAAQR